MPERDPYERILELYRTLPPFSEEETRGLIIKTIKVVEEVVLKRTHDDRLTAALLSRDFNTIAGNLGGRPNVLFLACYTASTSAGMFLAAIADQAEKMKHPREEKAYRDGEQGLIAVCVPFLDATSPSKLLQMRREAGINRDLATTSLIIGVDISTTDNLRMVQEHQMRLIRPLQESIETEDQTGIKAMENAIASMRMNPRDSLREGVYTTFAVAGAELAQNYYTALYPAAERVILAGGE